MASDLQRTVRRRLLAERVLYQTADGVFHFNVSFRNAKDLNAYLKKLRLDTGMFLILKLALQMHYAYNTRRILGLADENESAAPADVKLSPDAWGEYNTTYPSGYIYPFSFVHPVTGEPTSESERNNKLNLKPNPFKPQ